jgi:hypothetical protein
MDITCAAGLSGQFTIQTPSVRIVQGLLAVATVRRATLGIYGEIISRPLGSLLADCCGQEGQKTQKGDNMLHVSKDIQKKTGKQPLNEGVVENATRGVQFKGKSYAEQSAALSLSAGGYDTQLAAVQMKGGADAPVFKSLFYGAAVLPAAFLALSAAFLYV